MNPFYQYLGYKEECQQVPIQFPSQHQSVQPGLETLMNPPPVFDNPNYIGTGKLKNKVALVTGGDSGIGRAVSLAFAKEGADICIIYYNEHEDAKITKSCIEAQGRRCLLFAGDVRDEVFCRNAVADCVSDLGSLDVLVNNAGVQFPKKDIEDISMEEMEITFQVNFFGIFLMTKIARPYLKCGSTIINTTSVTAYNGNEQLIDYSSTKGAIVSFTRSMAHSLVSEGIRVNAVAPGPIWTPLQPASWPAEYIETFGSNTPMKRAGQPVELAPTYVYLASDDSSYVTGQVLHVDGGQSMQS
ncbi:SDR family oxidoreductase [Faecalicatena contorta]|uniref:NAD(P)-dependent dehydrogenase, short-chain alcohol dehydrogenase family n=1 Tax=Faecalicatena contorta TaxID=39482 RepID=A0A315ZRR2_9FIRM|nr:SDR family oxidoreductase [Faecalicatena contorta]PWJ48231.1 NAD(P)-dependent dehydrogenase (short-subunit alcohol dehydrogenase family) [Faecalicatena contorta]SUQ15507.1 NAD(P)-dependent dehydrogenase, short-chain alcohol dehydrogenase family [Faecalicatena contorta]